MYILLLVNQFVVMSWTYKSYKLVSAPNGPHSFEPVAH